MDFRIRKSFDPAKLPAEALSHWSGDPATLRLLGDSQNFVYQFNDAGSTPRILRITHADHRQPEQIEAELHFILHLRDSGCPVAAPLPSNAGNWVEPVSDEDGDSKFYAVVFEYLAAPLVRWGTDAENRKTLFELGRWLGIAHRASQSYVPKDIARFHWFNDDMYENPDQFFPESEPELRKEFGDLIHWLNSHPASPENYGLIHGDLNPSNYRVDGSKFIAIDFDDCCYHWFAYDIAIAMMSSRPLPVKYRHPYLQVVLEGYASERDPGPDAAANVAWFDRLAAMHRYVHLLRTYDLKNLTGEQAKAISDAAI